MSWPKDDAQIAVAVEQSLVSEPRPWVAAAAAVVASVAEQPVLWPWRLVVNAFPAKDERCSALEDWLATSLLDHQEHEDRRSQ